MKLAADAQKAASTGLEDAKRAGNDLAKKAQEMTAVASLSAEITYVEQQIANLKADWGRSNFDMAAAGHLAAVAESTAAFKVEKERLDAKLRDLQAKRALAKGEAQAAIPASEANSVAVQQMTIILPQGAVPGMGLSVQTPDGQVCTITVPPGSTPGSTITVEVPLLRQSIVQGVPMAMPVS